MLSKYQVHMNMTYIFVAIGNHIVCNLFCTIYLGVWHSMLVVCLTNKVMDSIATAVIRFLTKEKDTSCTHWKEKEIASNFKQNCGNSRCHCYESKILMVYCLNYKQTKWKLRLQITAFQIWSPFSTKSFTSFIKSVLNVCSKQNYISGKYILDFVIFYRANKYIFR